MTETGGEMMTSAARDEKTAPREAGSAGERAEAEDIRGETTTSRDLSAHRRHAWLYEDLLN